MAFQPSKKAKVDRSVYADPDLLPLMNIMLILIPLLVSVVSFIKFSYIQYNPNPAAGGGDGGGGGGGSSTAQMLNLVLNITENSFQISVRNGLPGSPDYWEVTKLPDGKYNFVGLRDRLMNIRRDIIKEPISTEQIFDPISRQTSVSMTFAFADANIINIAAKNDIPWKDCTRVLDVLRVYEEKTLPDGAKVVMPLFAEPVFGQIQ